MCILHMEVLCYWFETYIIPVYVLESLCFNEAYNRVADLMSQFMECKSLTLPRCDCTVSLIMFILDFDKHHGTEPQTSTLNTADAGINFFPVPTWYLHARRFLKTYYTFTVLQATINEKLQIIKKKWHFYKTIPVTVLIKIQ